MIIRHLNSHQGRPPIVSDSQSSPPGESTRSREGRSITTRPGVGDFRVTVPIFETFTEKRPTSASDPPVRPSIAKSTGQRFRRPVGEESRRLRPLGRQGARKRGGQPGLSGHDVFRSDRKRSTALHDDGAWTAECHPLHREIGRRS